MSSDFRPAPFSQFPRLGAVDEITHAVTTRFGPAFGKVGTDEATAVAARETAELLSMNGTAWAHQVHGDTILRVNESGIAGMRFSISETAEYGDVAIGPKIIDASVKKRMVKQLKEIESGKFAKAWIAEADGGCKNFNKIRKEEAKHQIEKVGERLRSTMSWIKQKKMVKGAAQASYVSASK